MSGEVCPRNYDQSGQRKIELIFVSNRSDPEGSFHYNKFSQIPKNVSSNCRIERAIGKDKNGNDIPHVNIKFFAVNSEKVVAEVCYLASCPFTRSHILSTVLCN